MRRHVADQNIHIGWDLGPFCWQLSSGYLECFPRLSIDSSPGSAINPGQKFSIISIIHYFDPSPYFRVFLCLPNINFMHLILQISDSNSFLYILLYLLSPETRLKVMLKQVKGQRWIQRSNKKLDVTFFEVFVSMKLSLLPLMSTLCLCGCPQYQSMKSLYSSALGGLRSVKSPEVGSWFRKSKKTENK